MARNKAGQPRETLWPGIAAPVLVHAFAVVMAILALVAVGHPGPHNHSLIARWGFGEVVLAGAWALYKLGSSRIVLRDEVMEIISWGLVWTVPRGEVEEAVITSEAFSMSIVLRDGTVIRPFMFLLTPAGRVYAQAGLFLNAGSRGAVAARITQWSREVPAADPPAAPARRWHPRLNLLLLAAASLIVAAEAISLTAANIW